MQSIPKFSNLFSARLKDRGSEEGKDSSKIRI